MPLHSDYIVTRAPHRITFGGGGSDFPKFYVLYSGAVLTTSINKYVYVASSHHSRTFKEKYRLHYSEIELCDEFDQIKNSIIRECLRFANKNWGNLSGLTISTTSDIPSNSGLGSSSAFCVALLLNLATRLNVELNANQLADIACEIEINLIGKPIGKQDQYATSLGGFNLIEFETDGKVKSTKIDMGLLSQVFAKHFCIISSGYFRSADNILQHQYSPTRFQIEMLNSMVENVYLATSRLLKAKNQEDVIHELVSFINEQTVMKFELNSHVLPNFMKAKYLDLKNNFFDAVKVNGAGGGGFFTGVRIDKLEKDFWSKLEENYRAERIDLDFDGAKLIYRGEI